MSNSQNITEKNETEYFQKIDADIIEQDFDNIDPFGDIPEEDNNNTGRYDDIDLNY